MSDLPLPGTQPTCPDWKEPCHGAECTRWDAPTQSCCFKADLLLRRQMFADADKREELRNQEKERWWNALRARLLRAAGVALGFDVARMVDCTDRWCNEHPEEAKAMAKRDAP